MSEFSRLVDIKFEDATSYTQSFTEDILCIPFFHHWGPTEQLVPINKQEFLETYDQGIDNFPEKDFSDESKRKFYESYVNVLRAFDAGIGRVIPFRVESETSNGVFTSYEFTLTGTATAPTAVTINITSDYIGKSAVSGLSYPIWGFRYRGIPSFFNDLGKFDLQGYGLSIKYYAANDQTSPYSFLHKSAVTIKLFATDTPESADKASANASLAAGTQEVVEEFTGVIEDNVIYNGQNVSIRSIVESNSKYILLGSGFNILDTLAGVEGLLDTIAVTGEYSDDYVKSRLYNNDDLELSDTTESLLSDPDRVNFSLLYSSLTHTNDGDPLSTLLSIVNARKDANLLVGYDTTVNFDYSTIAGNTETSSFGKVNAAAKASNTSFLTLYLAARESYKALNRTWLLDGCAAWAGRMASVAQSVRINQLPSARVYGVLSATLSESLTFDKVLDLHEQGCNSIYQSAQGPTIFGIKALYYNQSSYWAKANVSRVTTRLIKYIYPEVMNVIHTEVVSDSIQRAKFTAAMNNILNEFKAAGNIKDQSYVITDDSINSDAQTKGGEILNVVFVIYFKKLTEKVQIKFVATDSSVDVQIS